MKRSEINAILREAESAFERHGWVLPPEPRWDVTDFGLEDFPAYGLVLVNLAEEPEYCEKVMFVRRKQVTPRHHHKQKKEDIICRWGALAVELFGEGDSVEVGINGATSRVPCGEPVRLAAGWRMTLPPGVEHAFWAESDYAIVGEVSTANDDRNDNFFADPRVGRFSAVEEDESAVARLVSD